MAAAPPDREHPAFPTVTVGALGALSLLASLVALGLRAGSVAGAAWIPVTSLAAAALAAAMLAAYGRKGRHVRRTEARLRRWLRPPRRLQLTREGKYFVGICIGIGFAAINTGNNLLYLLLGMLLSLIIASGVLSEMSLRGLRITRQPPARLHVNAPSLIGITLSNGKRRLPSFSVEVEDFHDGEPLDKRCWFLKVPGGRQQKTTYRHQIARRGRYRFTGFRLSTRFPFGLFRKSRLVEAEAELIVYPALQPIGRLPLPFQGAAGDEASARRGRRGEFYGLREYREGDDPRDVHWRSTARRGRLLVREQEDEAARRVTLFVDNALPGGMACGDERLIEGLERAVSLAASLAVHYLSCGFGVRMVARGQALPWVSGPGSSDLVLRALALLPTVDEDEPFAAGAETGAETLLIARPGAAPPTSVGRPLGRVLHA